MNTVFTKIVTSRNTGFIINHPKDGAENSPIVEKLDLLFESLVGSNTRTRTFYVTYSNGEQVLVSDVVESWIRYE